MSDRLLYTVSAKGSMRHDEFYEVMSRDWKPSAIEFSDGSFKFDRRLDFVRLFEALGYCEVDWEKRKVFAIPPSWIMLPHPGMPTAVLVGGRSPGLMRIIRTACRAFQAEILLTEHGRAWRGAPFPAMVAVKGSSIEALSRLAAETVPLRSKIPGVWSLLQSTAGIEEVLGALNYEVFNDPGWPKRVFDIGRLLFQGADTPGLNGSVLHAYTNPVSQVRMHVIWRDGRGAPVHRDWGRYLALSEAGRHVLHYSEEANALAVPVTAPLPALVHRAVALCTGRLPKQSTVINGQERQQMLCNIFQGVPSAIAKLAGARVGQVLQSWEPEPALRSELCLTAIR